MGYVHAVKDVSLGIAKEECFGLLGQNGAGKTTTFKMLTGDEIISSGSAYLDKYSVKKDIKKVMLNDVVLEYSVIIWLQIQKTEDIDCICNVGKNIYASGKHVRAMNTPLYPTFI